MHREVKIVHYGWIHADDFFGQYENIPMFAFIFISRKKKYK